MNPTPGMKAKPCVSKVGESLSITFLNRSGRVPPESRCACTLRGAYGAWTIEKATMPVIKAIGNTFQSFARGILNLLFIFNGPLFKRRESALVSALGYWFVHYWFGDLCGQCPVR